MLFVASIYSCSSNSDLNQNDVDTFINQQFKKTEFGGIIERKPWTKMKWTDLKINHIKPIEIVNENT